MTVSGPFADPLGGVDPATWDRLAPNELYSSSGWLRFCADDPGGAATAGAVHVPLPSCASTAMAVTALERDGNPFYDWDRQLAARDLPTLGSGGLLVGQRRGYQTTMLVSCGGDRDRAAAAIVQAVLNLRDRLPVGDRASGGHRPCVAAFLNTADALALRRAGALATPVALAAEAWFRVDAPDWGSWLAALPSRRRADVIRREQHKFASAGYRLFDTTLSAFIDDASRLQANTQARYGQPADVNALAGSFRAQSAAMGDAAQVVAARRPGEPVIGFCLYYERGNTLFLRTAGFDYTRLLGAAEYFNIVYYAPIERAINAGLRWIHAGIESEEAKAVRGARIRPLWLLDLDADSALGSHDREIRVHNASMFSMLTDSSRAVAGALVRDDWSPFC